MMKPLMLLPLLLSLVLPSPTLGCGGFFCQPFAPVLQRGEAIAFMMNDDDDMVTMHVQILYEGPAEGFSWVLPVPSDPEEISIGTDVLFRGLFTSTLPTFELEVINELSENCALDQATPFACPMFNMMMDNAGAGAAAPPPSAEAEVLQEGSVGPFDFVVLQAADNNPDGVFEWLETNGYDQPDEAAPLLNYYAQMGQKFVALRLQSDTKTGEIEPLVLTYEMPAPGGAGGGEIFHDDTQVQVARRRRALACVPIQLTRIAATDNMPIQVYVLGPARAVPLNYLEVELDDTKVDWVRCFNRDVCYDNDYRQRFAQVTDQINNHTFITEYAGSTAILDNQIAINVSLADLQEAGNPIDFLQLLANANVPDTRRVIAIIDEYIPYEVSEVAPFFCRQFATAYQGPGNGFGITTEQCLWDYRPFANWTWDPMGLATALDEAIFQPAVEAQTAVSQHQYLTRMYTRLSPTNMNKDPFFAFKPSLPTVSNQHRATAVPQCRDDGTPIALDITVAGQVNSFSVMATLGCQGWFPTDPIVISPNVSFAKQIASWGFADDEGVVVLRTDDGTFDRKAVQMAIAFGDSLVMNQTIPEYVMIVTTDDDDDNDNSTMMMMNNQSLEEEMPTEPTNNTDTADSDLDTAVEKIEVVQDKPIVEEEDGMIEEDEGIDEQDGLVRDDSTSSSENATEQESSVVVREEDDSNARDVPNLQSSAADWTSLRLSWSSFPPLVIGGSLVLGGLLF